MCAAGSCCVSASSTTRRRRWRSTGRSSWRRRCRWTRPPGRPSPVRESYPPIEAGWLGRPAIDAEALRSIALFASLAPSRWSACCSPRASATRLPGEAIVEQWQISRDLYVVLDGEVAVTADGKRLNTLGPGEFFGELAAVDWGAGFARTRSATVTALGPVRLLALDWVLVNTLLRTEAGFAERLESATRERLPTL